MSSLDASARRGARAWRSHRLAVGLAVLALALGLRAGAASLQRYRFALNETDSLPNWAFMADGARRTPRRGDVVAFRPPATPYYPAHMAFGKIVGGIPGDLVQRRGRMFFVNGQPIGPAKPRARDGRAVEPGPVGRIPPGEYFVYTPSPDSLDSRYALIGWIPQSSILGLATPVL